MVDTSKMCFVFGSNEAGRHGAGAARYAHDERGAIMGCGFGHMHRGKQPGSFAIPTKDRHVHQTLSIWAIEKYVDAFITYAHGRLDLDFQITCIGCGLAGLKHEIVAPLFREAPVANCYFDLLWQPILGSGRKYWGTF